MTKLMIVSVLVSSLWVSACDDPEQEKQTTASQEDALATRPDTADPTDWCAEHGVPESMCTVCHPELVQKYKAAGDFCADHGYPESVCPQCHPMEPPAGAAEEHEDEEHGDHGGGAGEGDWCAEHGIPESMCTVCHPELTAKFKESGDWCAEHEFPESACPTCNPMTPPGEAAAEARPFPRGTRVRLKSTEHEEIAGLQTVPVRRTTVGLGVRAPARVEYDRNAVADIRAPVTGMVRDVKVDLGDRVEKGSPLFVLESAEVGDVQARIDSARRALEVAESNLARQRTLNADGIASGRKVESAEQRVESARARLGSLRSSLRLAGAAAGANGRFTVRSPIVGTVVRRPAVVGTAAGESTSLATVADTEKMWAFVDVPEQEVSVVGLGQTVSIEVDGQTFAGEVTWVSPEVDPRTRAVVVRAEIDNAEGRLRANQFVEAEIGIAPDRAGIVVPASAIQRLDEHRVVFVKVQPGVFEPRLVEPGRKGQDVVQVSGDLAEGDPVVTTGAYLLKTELRRDAIGAGCCEVPGE